MSRIYVCPLSKLEQTVRDSGARALVSLIDRGTPVPRPPSIEAGRHLLVSISDICERVDGHVLVEDSHVCALLDFVAAWDRRAPMAIHCYAGVSRSTAAAFIAACALTPDVEEERLARALRRASPTATPNKRLVALADARLDRAGRMIKAADAIGRGAECFEGAPFFLDLVREASAHEKRA
jgi:predicted protein tyrosine phosphatase